MVSPEDAAHASGGDVAFGPSDGLLAYVRHRGSPWDVTHPERMIRARFVARSS